MSDVEARTDSGHASTFDHTRPLPRLPTGPHTIVGTWLMNAKTLMRCRKQPHHMAPSADDVAGVLVSGVSEVSEAIRLPGRPLSSFL